MSTVTIQWSMVDYAAQRLNSGNTNTVVIARDWTSGPVQIVVDKSGHWRHPINNNGSLSGNFKAGDGNYTFYSGSLMVGGDNANYGSSQSVSFSAGVIV